MKKARGRLERLLDLSLVGRIFAGKSRTPHQLPGRVEHRDCCSRPVDLTRTEPIAGATSYVGSRSPRSSHPSHHNARTGQEITHPELTQIRPGGAASASRTAALTPGPPRTGACRSSSATCTPADASSPSAGMALGGRGRRWPGRRRARGAVPATPRRRLPPSIGQTISQRSASGPASGHDGRQRQRGHRRSGSSARKARSGRGSGPGRRTRSGRRPRARQPGAGDVLGDVAPLLDPEQPVAAAVHDQRRDPDGGQRVPHVDQGVHVHQRPHGGGRGGGAASAAPTTAASPRRRTGSAAACRPPSPTSVTSWSV